MNPELISRVIGLVDKNGDRIVLVDPQSGKAVVVMDLTAYEVLTMGNKPTQQVIGPATTPAVTVQAVAQEAPAIKPTPAFQPPVAAPAAPEAKPEKPSNKKDKRLPTNPTAPAAAETAAVETQDFAELTQTELLDKINRQIGAWKDAQERKRTEELQSAVSVRNTAKAAVTTTRFEEEERFYLEPIE